MFEFRFTCDMLPFSLSTAHKTRKCCEKFRQSMLCRRALPKRRESEKLKKVFRESKTCGRVSSAKAVAKASRIITLSRSILTTAHFGPQMLAVFQGFHDLFHGHSWFGTAPLRRIGYGSFVMIPTIPTNVRWVHHRDLLEQPLVAMPKQ